MDSALLRDLFLERHHDADNKNEEGVNEEEEEDVSPCTIFFSCLFRSFGVVLFPVDNVYGVVES